MEKSPTSRPLPTYAEEVFETVKPKIESTANGLPQDEVKTYLATKGFEDSPVEVALETLLNHGYIYVVNDRIRLTDSDT